MAKKKATTKTRAKKDKSEDEGLGTLETLYITDRGRLFSENDLKRFEMPQTQQVEEQNWGKQVIKPPYDQKKLLQWMDISVTHASCIRTKIQDSFGVGWKLVEIEGKNATTAEYNQLFAFFQRVNENSDVSELCKKTGIDYEGCGNGYFEVVRGLTEENKCTLYHVNSTTVALMSDKERWVQKVGQNKVYFKKFGDERMLNRETGEFKESTPPEKQAHELIHVYQYTWKSNYYGAPEWLPAVFTMFGEQKEKEFNMEFFTHFGVPAYAVVVQGAKLGKGVKEEIQKYFETELVKNPHRILVFTLKGGGEVKFERLSVETKEASFRMFRQDNKDDILTAHHVPPYRAGIVIKGQLGGSVARDVDQIYLESVVTPRQNQFQWVFNELIIKGVFEIESYQLEFLDIDITDEKLQSEIDEIDVGMGVKTPNDILRARGEDPYDGGDVYYVTSNLVPVGEKLEKGKDGKVPDRDPGLKAGAVGSEKGLGDTDVSDYLDDEEAAEE